MYEGKALTNSNIETYLQQEYNINTDVITNCGYITIEPFLQKDDNCTITSMYTLFYNLSKIRIKDFDVYKNNILRLFKFFYGYHDKNDTINPFCITKVMNHFLKSAFFCCYAEGDVIPKATGKYLKNFGWNFNTIKKQIDKNNPIILNLHSDGRNYYKDHSVIIFGYTTFSNNIHILSIYDNWSKKVRYIDYKKLSKISSINYLKNI